MCNHVGLGASSVRKKECSLSKGPDPGLRLYLCHLVRLLPFFSQEDELQCVRVAETCLTELSSNPSVVLWSREHSCEQCFEQNKCIKLYIEKA